MMATDQEGEGGDAHVGLLDAAPQACPVCGRRRASFLNNHGWKVHLGKHRAHNEDEGLEGLYGGADDLMECPSPASGGGWETESHTDGGDEGGEVVDTLGAAHHTASYEFAPFACSADLQLARLYTSRLDFSKGLLRDFLRVSREGPFSVKSPEQLLEVVDTLPGLTYTSHVLVINELSTEKEVVPRIYRFFSRSLVSCVNWLIDRHPESLHIPTLLRPPPVHVEDIWEAERCQEILRVFTRLSRDDGDVLVPLILYSDETNLTLFNTSSDQSTTYPLFLAIATLPKEVRRSQQGLINVALLPKYLRRLHKGAASKQADLKRGLTWEALRVVLRDLLVPSDDAQQADDGDDDEMQLHQQFAFLGERTIGGRQRRLFACLLVYLGGSLLIF